MLSSPPGVAKRKGIMPSRFAHLLWCKKLFLKKVAYLLENIEFLFLRKVSIYLGDIISSFKKTTFIKITNSVSKL